MAIRLRRPTDDQLAELLERCRSDQLSYAPVGVSLDPTAAVPGLHRRRWTTALPGAGAFDRSADALRAWAVQRGSGLAVAADGPIAVGTNVALSAPLPVGFIDATCRIVAVVDEPNRYGFAYGTLSVHPERGEEAFVIVRDDDGSVHFDVDAVSSPRQLLARLLPPAAHRLQDAAVRRYLSAMEHAVAVTVSDSTLATQRSRDVAYGVVHFFPGGTKDQYDASVAAVHPSDGSLPDGQTFHAAGESPGGWTIVAIHESQESWERFRDETLMPAMQAGIDGGFAAPPEETTIDVYKVQP